jgi:hypothetical protein
MVLLLATLRSLKNSYRPEENGLIVGYLAQLEEQQGYLTCEAQRTERAEEPGLNIGCLLQPKEQ